MLRSLTTALLCAYAVHSAHKDRAEQIKRMKAYQLAHLEPVLVEQDKMTLSFDAFDQHYEVELSREIYKASSNVKHTNVPREVHGPLSSLKESCHWQGRVVNYEGASVVSASFCKGRGIRARISAFNEILIIKPSAYYLDLAKDALANHKVEDEVLMYRVSDFDRPKITGTEGVAMQADDILMDHGEDMRRRLYTSSSPGQTEITVLIGPVRTANYQSDYGDNWYSQLFADTQDMMNSVDTIYAATNWNANGRSSIGGTNALRVVFSEIHVIYSFTGTYTSMAPQKRFTNCALADNAYDDSDLCAVYGDDWLGLISNWVWNNMDSSTYDNVQFITDIKFNWNSCTGWNGQSYVCSRTLGWGNIGVVCRGSSSVSVNSVVESFGGNENAIGTIAHELGHNFGLYHDGQSGPASICDADAGLMGYGDNDDTFSTCSLDSMVDYFEDGNGLACLGQGWDGAIVSNVGSNSQITSSPTSPTNAPTPVTPSPTVDSSATPAPIPPSKAPTKMPTYGSSDGCVNVDLGGYSDFDGVWNPVDGGYNGQAAYHINNNGNNKYLYYLDFYWSTGNVELTWIMGPALGEYRISFFCSNQDVLTCSGAWRDITSVSSGSWETLPSSSIDGNCVNQPDADPSCASYDCLYVTGTGDFDGYYEAGTQCNDDHRVFVGDDDNLLCYSDWYGRWLFSEEECGLGAVISSSTSGDVLSPNYWFIDENGDYSYSYARNVYISECNNNGAFTGLECLESNIYEEEICVLTNSSLWNSARTFTIYDELCANDQPIYHYIVYNESKTAEFGGVELGAEVEATFYVHYQPEYLMTTDTEMTGQWMLTKDEISVNYLAICQQEDLMDCTGNQWKIKITEFANEDGLNGIIMNILDKHMTVSDGPCGGVDSSEEGSGSGTVDAVVIVVVILLASILCLCAWYMWRRMNQNDALRIKQAVGNGHTVPTGTGAEEAEPEVEVEVSMENQGHITTHTAM